MGMQLVSYRLSLWTPFHIQCFRQSLTKNTQCELIYNKNDKNKIKINKTDGYALVVEDELV